VRHLRPPVRTVLAVLATAGVLGGGVAAVAVLSAARPIPAAAFVPAPTPSAMVSASGPVGSPSAGSSTSVSPSPSSARSPSGAVRPVPGGPGLLIGVGDQADDDIRSALVKQAPAKMLTSWYNKPTDLAWLSSWRNTTIPQAYAAGFAMHLVVWNNDPEAPLSTAYGSACGRAYPLSDRFLDDIRQMAQVFGGKANGPPLYVTMFTEFETYPCKDNAWKTDTATTNYYRALQDRYRAAFKVVHDNAPNAKVSLGWGGWQASYDNPGTGGGRSLFPHFADIMRMSDFQSFQAMDNVSNIDHIKQMVGILGQYGPVMLAHYKPGNASKTTFDADLHTIFTDEFLASITKAGLFAMSFMDTVNLDSSPSSFAFVRDAVTRYGRGW
jgi:hypothetical protein